MVSDMTDPKIIDLRRMVTAAQEEFDMAATYHEVWKPTAYDEALHSRMGAVLCLEGFPGHASGAPTRDGARDDAALGQ
jgi:hypothetical protein